MEIDFEKLLEEATALGIEKPDALDVDSLQQAIDEKKEALAKKIEADKKAKETTDGKAKEQIEAKKAPTKKPPTKPKAKPPVKAIISWTDANGDKWGFKPNAPKAMNWNGELRTQEELLKDDSVMKKLTLGQYSFIKRL